MFIYFFILVVLIFCYLASNHQYQKSKGFLIACMIFLGLFVGLSDMLGGYDRYIYGALFDSVAAQMRSSMQEQAGEWIDSTSLWRLYSSEPGYCYFNIWMGYVTQNRYIFIFTATVIIYILWYFALRDYAEDYPLALIIFMGIIFFFTFTYLRQMMAVAISTAAIRYYIRRKPIPYFLIITIAYTFHNSAIILAPMYFIPLTIYNRNFVIIVMAICLTIGLTNALGGAVSEVGNTLGATKAEGLVTDMGSSSMRYMYVIEVAVLLSLIFWQYSQIDKNNKKDVAMLNLAISFCAILLLFIRSENGGRFSWFFMIGIIGTFTTMASKWEGINSIAILCILLFSGLYTRMVTSWDPLITPYKTFLTNGRTENYIYDVFEYDQNYAVDKFYKL